MARISASNRASNGSIEPHDEGEEEEERDAPSIPIDDGAPFAPNASDFLEDSTDFLRPAIKRGPLIDPSLLPGGSRDLSSIGLQAFVLGNLFTGSLLLTTYLLSHHNPWWRLPAFLSSLSMFHFLEYYTTARYNTPQAKAASFIIWSNGNAYTIAHTSALTEIVLSQFWPGYQRACAWSVTMAVGAVLVVVCQVLRSVAMAQAGRSFNHAVATEYKEEHVLVTQGLYAFFRHPSYFGYFWWALGTQLMVGNKVCLVAFAVVLWRFFNKRIRIEESHLVNFFGEKYEDYRKAVGTKIPFIY